MVVIEVKHELWKCDSSYDSFQYVKNEQLEVIIYVKFAYLLQNKKASQILSEHIRNRIDYIDTMKNQ